VGITVIISAALVGSLLLMFGCYVVRNRRRDSGKLQIPLNVKVEQEIINPTKECQLVSNDVDDLEPKDDDVRSFPVANHAFNVRLITKCACMHAGHMYDRLRL